MARFRFARRHLLLLVGGSALFGGMRFGHARLARQARPSGPLSDGAQELIRQAWAGLDPKQVLDVHTHLVGSGTGGTGCTLSARLTSPTNPVEYFKFTVYLEAAGVTDEARLDEQYLARLSELVRGQAPHGRHLLLAFDRAHDEAGQPLEADSELYTPNEYVLRVAKAAPDLFVPAASVHPWRRDAVEALQRAVEAGAMAVKWLPNSMNIDPSSPRCDPFYEAMARLKVPLITHAGEEKAVHAEERQRLGNPLLLRRALEHGVTTVVGHCASLGQNADLDAPGQPPADNFELFLRLMREPRWEGLLFGDVSALALVNRVGRPLETVLQDEALQRRLVNGSDYPVVAINAVMQTRAVVEKGFLTEDQRTLLNEIDRHNPLLMDFVLKRTLRWRKDGREHALSPEVFTARPEVFPRLT